MKKIFAILVAVLMLCTVFVACSSEPAEPIIGEWDLHAMSDGDLYVPVSETAGRASGTLTVNKDGTFEINVEIASDDFYFEGEWDKSSETIDGFDEIYSANCNGDYGYIACEADSDRIIVTIGSGIAFVFK